MVHLSSSPESLEFILSFEKGRSPDLLILSPSHPDNYWGSGMDGQNSL